MNPIFRASRLLVFLILSTSLLRAEDPAPKTGERVPVWTGVVPESNGKTPGENAWLTYYPAPNPNGAAVVICPGGGYGGLVVGGEGKGIAEWLNRHGIHGFVLEYRLPAGRSHVPLMDAQQAILNVRQSAKKWGCDPKKIGIMGFSAGGHLAASATAIPYMWKCACSIDSTPNFAILVYPVISMGPLGHSGSRTNLLGPTPSPELIDEFSLEKRVTEKTPPVFLTHALDDTVVSPEHSRLFLAALKKHNIPAEYLELPSGGHGLNGYKGPMWDAWQRASLQWLASRKVIPAADANR